MAEFDFVVKNGLVVNTSFTANSTRVALGSNVVLNTSSVSVSNSISNVRISESSIIIGNTVASVTVNSTAFTGTANNTSFVGTTAAAAVVNSSQLSANLANYVTTTNLSQNLVNYQTTAGLSANVATLTANNTSFVGSNPAAAVVNTAQLSGNLALYQTSAGLSANVARLTANNTSFVGSVEAANVVSNTQLQANLGNYQTTAGLSANVALLSSNNATNLNGQPASFYLNATNINAGTLAWARAPVNTVNTTGSFTFTGVQTFNGNTTFNSNVNIGTIGLIANGSVGSAGQILHSNGSSAYWDIDNEGVTSVATGNGMIGGTITTTGTVSVLANTGIVANSTGTFVNAAYIGTLTANNTSFVGSNPASAVVNTAQLALYAPLAGATFTGPLNVTNNVTVTGNLIVTGTTLYANVTNLDVRDKNITVAFGSASAAATDGAGLLVDVSGASMRYTHSSNTWEFNIGLMPSANNSWDLGLPTLRWNNVYGNNVVAVNISGNGSSITSVNAATVGGNTATALRSYSDSVAATSYSNSVNYVTNASYTRLGITTFSANVILGSSGLSVNGSFGSAGQILYTNGTATYWANATGGAYYKGNLGTVGIPADMGNLFRLNSNSMTASVTIAAGENALTCGPITISSGQTLTIQTGGRAVII